MVDEGLTQVAATALRTGRPSDRYQCRRRKGQGCRLVVWGLVLGAFAAGCVMPMSAKADGTAALAAPVAYHSPQCATTVANKLNACLSPQHSPRR